MATDDQAKLKALLEYWINHNQEHSQEFREWADRARDEGRAEIAAEIAEAAGHMDRAGEILSRALNRLQGV